MQQEKNKLTYKSAFDIKLEKLANYHADENNEAAWTVKLESSGNTNSADDTNEEVISTVKLETSNRNDSNFEGSAVWSCC